MNQSNIIHASKFLNNFIKDIIITQNNKNDNKSNIIIAKKQILQINYGY